MIRRGVTSKEHDDCVLFICKKFELKPVKVSGEKGRYFPDAVNSDTDYEVEVVPRKHYIAKKEEKWDEQRKKILILRPNSFAYEIFDEIYIFSDNDLIKIK